MNANLFSQPIAQLGASTITLGAALLALVALVALLAAVLGLVALAATLAIGACATLRVGSDGLSFAAGAPPRAGLLRAKQRCRQVW